MQLYTLSQTSLVNNGGKPVEYPIPLWVADGQAAQWNCGTEGSCFLADGTNSPQSNTTGSNTRLFTLNSNWSPSQKYAFEATIYVQSGYTAYAELYDVTSSTYITASRISSTSTTATVVRSGQFTLTPGHVYAVTFWGPNQSSIYEYISDASLIVFP